MTVLAASDSPQLYVPANNPYAWFTMPMLFWALGILAFGVAAGVGMCVVLVRRLNAIEDDHDTRLVRAHLDARKTAADVARIDGDVTLLFNAHNAAHNPSDDEPPTDDFARDLIHAALHPTGRHAAPEEAPRP